MRTEIKRFDECSSSEIAAFKKLVVEADEVDPVGFDRRLVRANRLIFLYGDESELAGVAAVKRPSEAHKQSVFRTAQSLEEPASYAFEIGWIVVDSKFRNRRLSRELVAAALSVIGNACIFATVRTINVRMQKTNERFGFQLSGQPFRTNREGRDYDLSLFIRPTIGS